MGTLASSGPPFRQRRSLGTPVESLRSIHARVAALARHRAPNDPEVAGAREQLALCRDQTNARRALNGMSPDDRARFLASFEGAPSV